MVDQEKKRHRAPMNYALFDATSDDDFSDFTPPAKKIKDLDCSISSSSENKISSSNDDKRKDDKRKHKSSHKDRDKERSSSSSSGKDRDKHKSSSKDKEREKSSSSSSSSKDRDREKNKSSSHDKDGEKNKNSSQDKDRDKRSNSKDKERDKHKSSSRDKERDKHKSSSRDKERDKRSRSKDRGKEKEKGEKSKSDITVNNDNINKMREKKDENNDDFKSSRKERSRSRSQEKDYKKSQDTNDKDKIKRRNSSDESIDKCKEIEEKSNNKDGRIVEVCYDDIKFNMTSDASKGNHIFEASKGDQIIEASKGDQIHKAVPVSIGPLTSTQKSTPERRKPKERLTVEEKVFQRELEAALNISKLEVTADPETLKVDDDESENSTDHKGKNSNEDKIEVAIDISKLELTANSEMLKTEEKGDESKIIIVHEEKESNEVHAQNEELKVPKLILKVKTNENVIESIQKNETNHDNCEKDSEIKTSPRKDMPLYEVKKDEGCQESEAGNENFQNKFEKAKVITENIKKAENIVADDNKSKSCSEDTKISSDQKNSVYENPEPSTSTGFISGKRQRKTVVFKEESDSQESDLEDEEFSVQSDSKDSSFEISPIKKPKKENKVSNPKPGKKAPKNEKSNNEKEKSKPEKENANRISPRSRGNRKTVIIDDDFDTEEFKSSSTKSSKSNKIQNKYSNDTKADIKESNPLNVNSPKLDKNDSPIVGRNRKPTKIESDSDEDGNEFKSSSKKKSKPTSKDEQNIIAIEYKESNDSKDDMKENNPMHINSPKIDENKSPQVKRSRKPTKIDSDSDQSDEDFDCNSDDSEFKPSPKKKSKSASNNKQNNTITKNKESNEKSKSTLNTKSLPANAVKAIPVNSTNTNIISKSVNATPIRSTGIPASVASRNSVTSGMTKPVLSPTQGRVSPGLVKTPFRSPLMNTSGTTPNYIPRSTTPEVRSIGLRIGLSRNRAFKPLHPNMSKK